MNYHNTTPFVRPLAPEAARLLLSVGEDRVSERLMALMASGDILASEAQRVVRALRQASGLYFLRGAVPEDEP